MKKLIKNRAISNKKHVFLYLTCTHTSFLNKNQFFHMDLLKFWGMWVQLNPLPTAAITLKNSFFNTMV